jgi:hypothetical protein
MLFLTAVLVVAIGWPLLSMCRLSVNERLLDAESKRIDAVRMSEREPTEGEQRATSVSSYNMFLSRATRDPIVVNDDNVHSRERLSSHTSNTRHSRYSRGGEKLGRYPSTSHRNESEVEVEEDALESVLLSSVDTSRASTKYSLLTKFNSKFPVFGHLEEIQHRYRLSLLRSAVSLKSSSLLTCLLNVCAYIGLIHVDRTHNEE